jgi:hypothetical protein
VMQHLPLRRRLGPIVPWARFADMRMMGMLMIRICIVVVMPVRMATVRWMIVHGAYPNQKWTGLSISGRCEPSLP